MIKFIQETEEGSVVYYVREGKALKRVPVHDVRKAVAEGSGEIVKEHKG